MLKLIFSQPVENQEKIINNYSFALMRASIYLTVLLIVFSFKAKAQQSTEVTRPKFMVVGYTRNHLNLLDEVKQLPLDKITHLNIAFVNPDSTGQFKTPANLKKVTKLSHKKQVMVLLSIGGGAPPKYLSSFLTFDKRTGFISSLIALAVANNVDGIDVDLEGRMIDSNYESFVTDLGIALRAKKKLMTAAIATYYADRYSDKALAQFDFLNEMSYDKTGPWNPDRPGQHAPFDMAVSDIDYWTVKRGIVKAKLNLGLPFYGYGFGNGAPADISFKDLIATYPGAENSDEVTVAGGGRIYYNGVTTIKRKTTLALKNAGGVMIWQLLQDADAGKSLVNAIDEEIRLRSQQ